MAVTTPTKDEIYDQIDAAEAKSNRWPGMTYEDGVSAALRWALGDTDELPIEDE